MSTLNIKNFPSDLYARLQSLAERERRSVAQQVIHLLERSLEQTRVESLLDLRGLGRQLWTDVEAGQHVSDERDSWAS